MRCVPFRLPAMQLVKRFVIGHCYLILPLDIHMFFTFLKPFSNYPLLYRLKPVIQFSIETVV